jgi:hypothetical protein
MAKARQCPTFTLFRYPNAANQAAGIGEYVGALVVPGDGTHPDRVYSIEADVSDYDKPDGTKGKYFKGTITGGQEVVRQMARGAKIQGDPPADLLTMLEERPFDDPLPDFSLAEEGAESLATATRDPKL